MELTRPKIILLAIIFGIFFIADMWMTDWKKDQENIRDRWRLEAGFSWKEEEVRSDMLAFEQAMIDAEYALRAKDYVEAERVYREGVSRAARWRDNYGDKEFSPGNQVRTFVDSSVKKFNQGPRAKAMEKLVFRLFRGEGRQRDQKILGKRFESTYDYQVQKIFSERKREIGDARAELAGNWVRLVVNAPHDFEIPVEEEIVRHWNSGAGRELVMDTAFTPRERDATLKTVTATVTINSASFSSARRGDMYELPESVTLSFRTETGRDALAPVKSSWDALPGAIVKGDFKTVYNVELDYEGQSVDFSEEKKHRMERLLRKVVLELNKLPKYSEMANTSISLEEFEDQELEQDSSENIH